MAKLNLVYTIVYIMTFTMVLATEDLRAEYEQEENITDVRPVGRAYSVSTCDYRTQIGYTCLSCHRALHCYPGNVAILVDCYGPFRFCRDGRCSRFQGDKCLVDNKLTTSTPLLDDNLPANITPDVTTRIAEAELHLPEGSNVVDNSVSDAAVSSSSDNV